MKPVKFTLEQIMKTRVASTVFFLYPRR